MGNKFTCNIHGNENKFYCQTCNQFLCELCINSHSFHEIKHIDAISFEISSELSKSISGIDLEIHKLQQSSNYEDLTSNFNKCYNSLRYISTEISCFEVLLKTLQSKLNEYCRIFTKKVENHIQRQFEIKKELESLNKQIIEVSVRKDYNMLNKSIISSRDQLSLISYQGLFKNVQNEKKGLVSILNQLKEKMINYTNYFSKVGKNISEVLKVQINAFEEILNNNKNQLQKQSNDKIIKINDLKSKNKSSIGPHLSQKGENKRNLKRKSLISSKLDEIIENINDTIRDKQIIPPRESHRYFFEENDTSISIKPGRVKRTTSVY